MSYWSFVGRVVGNSTRVSISAANSMSQGVAAHVRAKRVRPSNHSMRRGILVPGDGPQAGTTTSFFDFRDVLMPEQVTSLRQGVFPLGRVQDPGCDDPAFPVFLDWDFVARHVAVIGPAGSGKTYNVLAPWIVAAASQGLTTVAVDVKGDLLQEIRSAKARSALPANQPIVTWDISDPSISRPWNPLGEIHSPEHASQAAMAFLGEVNQNDPQKFFAERDHRWLRGLFWLTSQGLGTNAHPSALYKLIVSQPDLVAVAASAPQAAHELLDLIGFDKHRYSEATSGLANKLSWLAEPGLAPMLDGSHARAFTLSQALNSGAILLIGARERGGERTATAASIFLNLLRLKCLERFGSNPVPVFWVLDEAPRYAKRIQLDQMLDLLRGAKSPICIGLQDVNHLGSENEQVRLLANCETLITLKGCSQHTAKFFSDRLGVTSKPVSTMTLDAKGQWKPSVTFQDQQVLGGREIMYPPVGQYGGVAQLRGGHPLPFLFSFDEP